MALSYQTNGCLVPAIHLISLKEFISEFGFTAHRLELIEGLKRAMNDLKECGCSNIYIDGSFTTKKLIPNDYDACWDPSGVNLLKLRTNHPVFFDFANSRENQKKKYLGEFFPTIAIAVPKTKELYIDFFQHDRDDVPKGIVRLQIT